MDDHESPLAVKIVDPHTERLLRDLMAIGVLEANNRPSADERLTATLGEDFLWLADMQVGKTNNLYVDNIHYDAGFSREIARAIGTYLAERQLVSCG